MPTSILAIVKNGKIELITPIDLPEGTSLLILLNPTSEAIEWSKLSINGLSHAYDDEEPDYEIAQLKEMNPIYEGV